jgi:hypothetical protein
VRLTEGLWRPETRRREEVDDDRRRRDRVLAGRGDPEVTEVLGWRGSAPGTPAEVTRGSGRPKIGRHRGNWGGGTAHRRRYLRKIPVMQRLGARVPGSGSF